VRRTVVRVNEDAGLRMICACVTFVSQSRTGTRCTTMLVKNDDYVDNALLDGYYPEGFDDVHAYKMHPTNAKDVPGTDTPADAFLSKI